MKKLMILAAACVAAVAFTACGSARTPTTGPRYNNVYYNTFFGISIESAVYGDGLVVSPMK
jgi:hypothetical protein